MRTILKKKKEICYKTPWKRTMSGEALIFDEGLHENEKGNVSNLKQICQK